MSNRFRHTNPTDFSHVTLPRQTHHLYQMFKIKELVNFIYLAQDRTAIIQDICRGLTLFVSTFMKLLQVCYLACDNFCACVTQKGICIYSVPHIGHLCSKTGAKGSKWWNNKGYHTALIKS